jgi:hypothetical protein
MTQKMFEATTEAEAQKLADEWIKAHPGVRVIKRIPARMKSFDTPLQGPSSVPTQCTLFVEYEDPTE